MVRKVDIAPPTDQERLEQLRAEARRPHPSRMSKPMRPTKPTASDFDTNLDFRNRLADEGLFPTPISGKDTLPRRFNQPGYVPVWTPNPNERGGYSVYGFPQVVSADDAVMGMAPPSDSLDVHPYLMPFTVNRELLPPPSLNVEDRRSTAQTIQNLLAADPRTQGSWLMPDWRTPTARTMERSPGDTTTQEGTAERHFDPYLLQPDLSQMPTRVRVGDPNARQFELPGSVPADVPVPRVSTGRWGDQASLQGGGGSNTLAGGGGETLTMGPNEEAVSLTIPKSANIDKVDKRLVDIARRAAAIFPYEVRITPHGGANARKTGTPNHPGGYALDYQIQDPATGKWLDNYKNPQTFRVYEQYAQTMRQVQMKEYPELADALRYGGYFGDVAADQMHIDITPGANKPAHGTWEGGLGRNADGTPILDDKGNPIKLGRMARAESVGMGQGPVELPQTDQSAFASLLPPQGGTLTPGVRAGAEAYAPFLPPPSPGQAAITDLISPPSTTSDRDKLAGVMLAEARGEGREGRLGVGNVVLNRQAASGNRFPKTIDGVINNEFARPLGPNDVSPDEWAETTQEAEQLLNGAIPDNTGGAVYFANTATSKPSAYAQIANSGPVSATIGNHTFHTDAKIGAVARGTGDLTADQIDELTRTDVAGNYTNPLVAPPPARRPGPGGALGVDLGTQPAGMPPPPSRPGTFDWLGGGAPPAAMVPTPGISPLRPASGGPGDRRPQPPIPSSRPPGGPPPYPAASMANMPAAVGMPPSVAQGAVGAFSAPAGPSDLIPFLPPPAATAAPAIAPPLERANRIAGGQGGPVIPISPDEMRRSLANAGANTEMSLGLGGLGTPETAMSLDRTFPPLAAAPSPWSDRSRAFDIPPPMTRMAEFGPSPRPNITPDFDFTAGPGPTFTPPSLTPDIRGRPEYPGSMPAAPPPLANAVDDPYRAPSSFDASRPLNGGGGSDVLAAGNASPLSLSLPPPPPALTPSGDPWAKAYGGQGPTVPAVPSIDDIPGVTVAADPNNITLPEEPLNIQSPTQQRRETEPPPPLPTAANAGVTAPSQAKTPESQKRRSSSPSPSLLARIGNALVPGNPFGPGGGGVGGFGFGIGPGGFFSNAGSFTPSGAGGTSFFNQQPGGAMGTTNWRQGSVTGNPQMSGVMWNRSGDNGSVGYVTDPFTGSMIYSGSPNRF